MILFFEEIVIEIKIDNFFLVLKNLSGVRKFNLRRFNIFL